MLNTLVIERGVTCIVVGLPLHLNGRPSSVSKEVNMFINFIRKRISVRVVSWDERLSSVQSKLSLQNANVKYTRNKEIVDKVAAALLLKSYMESGAETGTITRSPEEGE